MGDPRLPGSTSLCTWGGIKPRTHSVPPCSSSNFVTASWLPRDPVMSGSMFLGSFISCNLVKSLFVSFPGTLRAFRVCMSTSPHLINPERMRSAYELRDMGQALYIDPVECQLIWFLICQLAGQCQWQSLFI